MKAIAKLVKQEYSEYPARNTLSFAIDFKNSLFIREVARASRSEKERTGNKF